MPIKHGGMLASRASTWLRDHFWRKTIAPRSSRPTMWNEYLPISIPITAIADLRLSDMACSCLSRPLPASNAGEAGARPDHPISRLRRLRFRPFARIEHIHRLAWIVALEKRGGRVARKD